MEEYIFAESDFQKLKEASIQASVFNLLKQWFDHDSNFNPYEDSIDSFECFFENTFHCIIDLSHQLVGETKLQSAFINFHNSKKFITNYNFLKQWLDTYKEFKPF